MVGIVNYGIGNLASVQNAILKLGGKVRIESNPAELKNYDRLILPGVGAFGEAMENLEKSGMKESILEFAKNGKPLLGICLGMQLLFQKSYEFGEHFGLGLIEGEIIKFDKNTKVWYIMFIIYRKSWLSILQYFSLYEWVYVRTLNGSALFFEDESKAINYVIDNYIYAFSNEETDDEYYNRIKDIPVDCLDEDDLFFMKSYKYIKQSEKVVYIEEIEKRRH